MRLRKRSLFERVEPALYLAPTFLFMGVFIYYPFLKTIIESFFLLNSMGEIREFVGFENYINVLNNSKFIQALGNTFKFVLFTVPFSVGLAFILALMASKKRPLSPLYESLKDEVVKAVQGRSRFPEDILSELVASARERMLDSCSAVTMLNDELAREKQRMDTIALDYQRVMGWADIFDKSEMPVKKMIVGYIIKRIDVYADYHLHIELNMNVEQFDLGLDFTSESRTAKMNA